MNSGIEHIVATVPVPKSEFEDEEFHNLVHGNAFPASPIERQLFYRDDLHKQYQYNGTAWIDVTAAAIDELNDIGDVNAPTPSDQQGIEWDEATSKWILAYFIRHGLLTARGDIITRSATVPKRLALGTEGHYLKAGASEPEWAAPVAGYTEGARVYHNANQNTSNGVLDPLALNSERYDTDNIHDNVTNNSRLTCRTAGKYIIVAGASFAVNVTGLRIFAIRKNGTVPLGAIVYNACLTDATITTVSTIDSLIVGDYVEFIVKQTSGGDLIVTYDPAQSPEFMMQRIG